MAQPTTSFTEIVYQKLRSAILACRYEPSSKLRINAICAELDASLGAVREALSRLAAEGLVISAAQKGFSVAPVSMADLVDLTKTRTMIENSCIARAIDVGGVEWEAEIVGSYHLLSRLSEVTGGSSPRPAEDWAMAHGRFHRALVSACDSAWLLRIREMLFDQSDRYRRMTATAAKKERDLNAEHNGIMQAVLARDKKSSARLIEAHFQKTAETAGRIINFQEPGVKSLKRRRRGADEAPTARGGSRQKRSASNASA
jgi:DNA-binding GntR family transcriptional regulator